MIESTTGGYAETVSDAVSVIQKLSNTAVLLAATLSVGIISYIFWG